MTPDEIARLRAVEAENTRLRAALAMSDRPCAYCSLPADEWAKCPHGFPGCARGDDAMGCPHLGASLEVSDLKAEITRLRETLHVIYLKDRFFVLRGDLLSTSIVTMDLGGPSVQVLGTFAKMAKETLEIENDRK